MYMYLIDLKEESRFEKVTPDLNGSFTEKMRFFADSFPKEEREAAYYELLAEQLIAREFPGVLINYAHSDPVAAVMDFKDVTHHGLCVDGICLRIVCLQKDAELQEGDSGALLLPIDVLDECYPRWIPRRPTENILLIQFDLGKLKNFHEVPGTLEIIGFTTLTDIRQRSRVAFPGDALVCKNGRGTKKLTAPCRVLPLARLTMAFVDGLQFSVFAGERLAKEEEREQQPRNEFADFAKGLRGGFHHAYLTPACD